MPSSPSGFFPVSVDDYIDQPIDLNAVCVRHPASTFFLRARGDAMRGAGIFDGDILIVDRSIDPASGSVVIAIVDGDFAVKRLTTTQDGRASLSSEQPASRQVAVTDGVEIWGVVTFVVHRL